MMIYFVLLPNFSALVALAMTIRPKPEVTRHSVSSTQSAFLLKSFNSSKKRCKKSTPLGRL